MLSLEEYIKSRKWKETFPKFAIILGSGFHKQAIGNHESILADWNSLLSSVSPKHSTNSGNYILDFERLIAHKTGKQSDKEAYEIEDKLLRKISASIEREQRKLVAKYKDNYPKFIFNPDYVSDVISLNFDIVPERLLDDKSSMVNELKGKDGKKLISTRHRNINDIAFWHPHGDIGNPESLMLGLRKYGNRIHECEQLRKRFKENERVNNKEYLPSWFDKLVKQPILILGSSLSPSLEWDIWFALVNRTRNFAKQKNKSAQHAMFKMTKPKLKSEPGNEFFSAILTTPTYKQQWKLIERLFL